MFLLIRLMGIGVILLSYILQPIFWMLSFKKKQKVPKVENEILLCSATELARRIREKEVTSLYVVTSYIERIKEVDPIINAVTDERYEAAIKDAKKVDKAIKENIYTKQHLETLKPFFGVPITIKESCGLKGLSQTLGSKRRIGIKAERDGASIERLKKAGFIPLLVSNCPEYCASLETMNLLKGITRNPYDTNRSAGGSSGGEAALLASAGSVVGFGSDLAGSIRLPCLFNGVYGHKTTPRIVPRKGHFPDNDDEESYDYFGMGPLTRYAEDLLPVLKIVVDVDGVDLQLNQKVDLSKMKVFYTNVTNNTFGIPSVDYEILSGIKKAVKCLEKNCGMKSIEINPHELRDSVEIGTTLIFHIRDPPNVQEDLQRFDKEVSLYMEFLKSFCKKSEFSILLLVYIFVKRFNGFIPQSKYPKYYKKCLQLKAKLMEKLGSDGVLLYPPFTSSAFQHFQILLNPLGISYSMIFNMLGFPTTSVPLGLDRRGMPIGIQVIAAPKMDKLCIAVAQELEKHFGGWIPPY